MERRKKPQTNKFKKIMNDCHYDPSCILTSFLASDLEQFELLDFLYGMCLSHVLCDLFDILESL
jgi:hypothetical protein